MARASYLQQTARRVVGEMPIIRPPRPLFRAWEPTLAQDIHEEMPPAIRQPTVQPIEPGSPPAPLATRRIEKAVPRLFTPIEQPETTTIVPPVTATRAPLVPGSPVELQPAQPFAGQRALREEQAVPTRSTNLKPIETASPAALMIDRLKPVPKASVEIAAPAITAAAKPQQGQGAPLRPVPRRTTEAEPDSTPLKRARNRMLPTQAEPAFLLPRPPEPRPPAPKAEQRQKASIHIGSIEVHITPTPPSAPPARTPAAQPQPASSLSRGFTSPFGIRQG